MVTAYVVPTAPLSVHWCHASSEVVKDGPRAWALAQAGQIWMKLLASTFNLLQLSQPAGKDGLSVSLLSPPLLSNSDFQTHK